MSKKKRYCCICGVELPKGELGFNPEPVKSFTEGTCCNDCYRDKVLPKRVRPVNELEYARHITARDIIGGAINE